MKNRICLLMLAAMLVLGCSHDSDENEQAALAVASAAVDFTAQGGTGEVQLVGTPVSVTASQDWCQAVLSGNVVTVTVERWTELEARCSVLTIADASGNHVYVSVHQDGSVWSLRGDNNYYINTDDETRVLIPMKIDFDYEVTSSDETWLSGRMTEQGYEVTLAENNSGARRRGSLTFSSEQGRRVYQFEQFGLRVIEGDYRATYYTDADVPGQTVTRTVHLTLLDEEKLRFRVDGFCDDTDIFAILNYNAETHDMSFVPGQQYPCGETDYEGRHVYGYGAMVGLYERTGQPMATYTPFQQDYPCSMNNWTGKPSFRFVDNDTWNYFQQIGFRLDLIVNQVPMDYNYVATVATVYGLQLKKL